MDILDIWDVRLPYFNNRKYAINTHSFVQHKCFNIVEIKLEHVFCLFSFEVVCNCQV